MKNKLLAAPYIVWMAIFILVPLGIVVYYALTDSITGQFTLANLASIGSYLPIFLRSIWLSLFAALICLVIGYPVAYFIAQCRPTTQRFLEMLIMLPMCMSFLLRTLAWVAMLEDTGIFNSLLKSIGLSPLPLIRTNGAVILGMVYNYLPYMILPLYTVIMKIDNRLVEAAADLGCTPAQVFFQGHSAARPRHSVRTDHGVRSAVSTFYISQKLGSTGTTLIGDVIESQFKTAYNPNLGAAMSLVLMILIFICVKRHEPLRRKRGRRRSWQGMKHFNRTVTVLVFIFLYIPMIVLGVASFNAGTDIATFKGFTLSGMRICSVTSTLLRLLLNSLIIAVLSTLIATAVGIDGRRASTA